MWERRRQRWEQQRSKGQRHDGEDIGIGGRAPNPEREHIFTDNDNRHQGGLVGHDRDNTLIHCCGRDRDAGARLRSSVPYGKLIRPGPLAAGQYTTVNFFGGALTVTVDDGWESHEDSTGEFSVTKADDVDVLFWLDPYPIFGTDCNTPSTCRVDDVGPSATPLTAWLRANPNLRVEDDTDVTLDGIDFDVLNISVGPDAPNTDEGCPAKPCANILGYPEWDFPWAIAFDSIIRLYVADVEYGLDEHDRQAHRFVIAVQGPSGEDVHRLLRAINIPALAATT